MKNAAGKWTIGAGAVLVAGAAIIAAFPDFRAVFDARAVAGAFLACALADGVFDLLLSTARRRSPDFFMKSWGLAQAAKYLIVGGAWIAALASRTLPMESFTPALVLFAVAFIHVEIVRAALWDRNATPTLKAATAG